MRSSSRPTQLVWFKKDLRLSDHACLAQAAARGPVLPVYVVEPDYWTLPDTSYRQYQFLKGCLGSLQEQLRSKGTTLLTRTGDVVHVLTELKDRYGDLELWSHQETGNTWTYERDEAVRAWCRENQTPFHEPLQFGVWRGSAVDRDHWSSHWDKMMGEPIVPFPSKVAWAEPPQTEEIPTAEELELTHDGIQILQPPGRAAAEETLRSFLYERGEEYRTDMSSPVTGESGCSRLSPHLTYGTLSMREIYQTTQKRIAEVAKLSKQERGHWGGALSSFVGRLHWHCHFTQKLELEPELERLPMARAYTGLRDDGDDEARLQAYAEGQTGYPFVDACMRYLRATGWINFRMRAMLMSFASYDLWLPWQKSGNVLARLFTDYEPGIHWPQSQMQSGVTGINAIRIYSPIKQGYDQDPTGQFTRQWVPELAHLPDELLQEPWKAEENLDYPPPIVEHRKAVAEAKSRVWAIRKTPEAKAEAEAVYQKHGSRKRPSRRGSGKQTARKSTKKTRSKKKSTADVKATKSKASTRPDDGQMSLALDNAQTIQKKKTSARKAASTADVSA